MANAEETWSIGEAKIQGNPVVYKFITAFPDSTAREAMPWLTVVSWKYDGSGNNGMPPAAVNDAMIGLEDALETIAGKEKLYLNVYSATGNNNKEFVFYIADRERFMHNFNQALRGHPVYPVEINFYQDEEWSDLARLHRDFGVAR